MKENPARWNSLYDKDEPSLNSWVQARDCRNIKSLLGVLKITVPDDLIGTISQFSPVPSSLYQGTR